MIWNFEDLIASDTTALRLNPRLPSCYLCRLLAHLIPGRVMPDAVLLLDDTILITNGAGKGFQGLSQGYASQGITRPALYDTRKAVGSR